MKKFKAIVSDFDGTLSDSSLTIKDPVKQAIKEYVKNGGTFSIATGRDYYGALKDICIDLGIESLHIVRGGSEIVSSKTHEVIWGKYINQSVLKNLLGYLHKKEDIYFVAERGAKIYTKNGKPNSMFGSKAIFGVLEDMLMDSVPKVFLPAGSNDNESVLEIFEEIKNLFPELHVIKTTHEQFIGIDINDGGVSKHLALLEYAGLMNLDPKEIVGIGDSYNDYPLLSACGYKVAMGNAPEELTEVADMIVGTQKENGILELFELMKK